LHGLAMIHQAQGKLDEAGPMFRQAVRITEAALGEENPVTLRLVHSLGLYEQASGEFRRAEEHLCRARDQMGALLGDSSPLLVPVLSDLARLYAAVGDHLTAEAQWRRVRGINHAAFSTNELQSAQDQVNLALSLRAQGEFAEAEQLVRESLVLLEQARGPQHPELAAGHGLLASLAQSLDRYGDAERRYAEALDRTRLSLGQGHPAVAMVLIELAGLQATRGRPNEALASYQQARDIFRRAQLEDHAESINVLRLQAGLLQSLGRLPEAEQLYQQRLAVLRRMFGADGPALVPAMQLLADVYRLQGKLEQAQQTCEQALATLRKSEEGEESEWTQKTGPGAVMGPSAGALAVALAENNLATMLLARGRAEEAEPLLRRALDGVGKSVGEDHPAFPGLLVNLAGVSAARGRAADARQALARLADIDRRLMPQMLALSGDRHRAMACHGFHDRFELYVSAAVPLVLQEDKGDQKRDLFDLVLQRKRLGIEVLASPAYEAWGRKYPDQAAELRRLWRLDRQVANKRAAGPGFEGLERHRDLLTDWLDQRDAVEQRLGQQVPELAQRRRLSVVDTAKVSAALPAGWALVEFLHYRARDLARAGQAGNAEAVEERYVAFVLRAGEDAPALVDLGPAADVNALVKSWREELEGGAPGAGAAIRDRVWAPLLPLVSGCPGLVLALDGDLLHLPMAAVPLADGGVLGDRFLLRQVLSGRDLLRVGGEPSGRVLVVGHGETAPMPRETGLSRFWGGLRRFAARQTAEVAQSELDLFEQLLGATRSPPEPRSLLEARGAVVHLGVPPFFRLERAGNMNDGAWQNPLECSGLSLSAGHEVTSLQITGADFWSTRLVVLAVCSTPAGEPGLWSKVSGLVSAFLQAGARNVLLSLWQAPPAARRELLTAFYTSLAESRSPAESLRLARKAVRERDPSTVAWAGWVLIGSEW
jgi:tetratricopeptide (TPR) repeat protein